MITIKPSETSVPELHQYIIGAVAPRPIAFVSSLSATGVANLAPYSFFNAYSSNPPTLVFSSNRRVRGNTTKDTLENVLATREVVINVVNYAIVYQMALCSVEYPDELSEFDKSGLTPIPSELVKPFRVKESPVQFECRVKDVIALGKEGGAGNLVICEILRIHLNPAILDEEGKIDPQKADLMGRMGRAYYCRAQGDNVFPIVQPVKQLGMGVDQLPAAIKLSSVLTGNDLARLASVTALPERNPDLASKLPELPKPPSPPEAYHHYAQHLIAQNQVDLAWQVLLQPL